MENVRKGEIACKKQFLLFSQCFLPCMALIFHFECTLKCHLQFCFNLDQSKILSSGNGLKLFLLFPQCFKKDSFCSCLKLRLCCKDLKKKIKLKAFVDNKIQKVKEMNFVFHRIDKHG